MGRFGLNNPDVVTFGCLKMKPECFYVLLFFRYSGGVVSICF